MGLSKNAMRAALGWMLLAGASAASGALAAETTSTGDALRAAALDGTWSGTTKCLYDPGLWEEDVCDSGWIITIDGSNAQIEMITKSRSGKETHSRVDDRPIFVRRLETNAVLTTIDSGNDEDGHWVETWTLSVSLRDKDHLLVHWNRVVNNTDFPLDRKGSKFSIVQMGELVRSAPAKPVAARSASAPTDASLDELLEVGRARQMIDILRTNFSASFRTGVESSLRGKELSPQKRRDIDAVLAGFDQGMNRVMNWQTVRPIYIQVYRETFSQEEVDGMIAFARSPAGRAQLDKMPIAMEKTQVAMKPLLDKMLEEMKSQASKAAQEAAPGN